MNPDDEESSSGRRIGIFVLVAFIFVFGVMAVAALVPLMGHH